jgi:hypothetical protein
MSNESYTNMFAIQACLRELTFGAQDYSFD